MDNKHIGATGRPNTFQQGMITDSTPLKQPAGSYRFGLNLVKGTKEGDRDTKATEPGNEFCFELPEGFFSNGREYISSDLKLVTAVNPTTGESIIATVNHACETTIQVRSFCLGFRIDKQIQITHRVRLGCEDTIYLTDDFNPVRYFNLTDQSSFYSLEYKAFIEAGKAPESFVGEKWDCEKFRLIRGFTPSCIENVRVTGGGQNKSGSQNYAVRWLDEDFNPTPWFPTSQTVNIYKDYTTGQAVYSKVMGSSNIDVDPAGGTINSGKAVEVTRGPGNPTFPYWQLAVIQATSLTGKITDIFYSPPIPMDTDTFTVDGDFNTWSVGDITELRLGPVDIDTAKTITQLENRLILGNIQGKQYDVCGFQKAASKICTNYIVKEVPIDDIHSVGDAKNPNTLFTYGSHQGGEVAANGIVFVFDDGQETPVYHVPGPAADTISCAAGASIKQGEEKYCLKVTLSGLDVGPNVQGYLNYEIDGVPYEFHFNAAEGSTHTIHCDSKAFEWKFISGIINVSQDPFLDKTVLWMNMFLEVDHVFDGKPFESDCVFINENGQFFEDGQPEKFGIDLEIIHEWFPELEPLAPAIDENNVPYAEWPDERKIRRWQYYNTAVKLGDDWGRPGYYACSEATYPDIRDCDNKSIWGVDACGNALVGTPIRHPRLPDRRLEPHIKVVEGAPTTTYCLGVQFFDPTFDQNNPGAFKQFQVEVKYVEGGVNKTVTVTGRPLPFTIEVACSEEQVTGVSAKVLLYPDTQVKFTNSMEQNSTEERTARILGFEFDNIEYPHPDIVGHYFVTAIRDQQNKTIVDAGILGSLRQPTGKDVGFAYFTKNNNYHTLGHYLTPEFLVNRKETEGQILNVQGEFALKGKEVKCADLDGAGSAFANVDTIVDVRVQRYSSFTTTNTKDLPIEGVHDMAAISFEEDYVENVSGDLVNTSSSNRIQAVETSTAIPYNQDNIFYAYSRRYKDVYCDLFGLVYRRMHNCLLTPTDSQRVFGGDTFITPMDINNSLMRRIMDGFWDDVLKIVVIVVSVVASIYSAGLAAAALGLTLGGTAITAAVVAGAVGITSVSIAAYNNRYKKRQYGNITQDNELNSGCSDSFFEDSFIAYAHERIEGIYVESQINFALRQEYNGECGALLGSGDPFEFFKSKTVELNPETNKYEVRPLVCAELYWVNPDFSRIDRERIFLPVPRQYKCCSECLEDHPNREVWSLQSFQEERTDNFRAFRPNDYKDIEAQHGDIVNIIPYHGKLLTLTEDALFVSIASVQERTTGEVVTYIGTGDFLSNPERTAVDDDLGSVGCQHQWGNIKTKFGVLIADEKENSLYLYGQGIKDIFIGKNKAWAHKYFKSFLKESLKNLSGEEFVLLDNHANPKGIGIHMTYDPVFRRILITKRDYEIIPENFRTGTPDQSFVSANKKKPVMYYIDGKFQLYDGQELGDVDFTHTGYFRDRSFTLSYSPEDQTFIAFHSYIPLMYHRDKNNFFSSMDNKTWAHNADNVLSFYGKRYPAIIEGVDNTEATIDKYTDYLAFFTEAKRFDGVGMVDVGPITFTGIIAYNSTQTTGELKLRINSDADILLESVTEDTDTVIIGRRGKDFYINDLWDATRGEQVSLFKDDWESIRDTFFIDKVPNVSIQQGINEWDMLSPLYDKYLIYRMIYEPKDDTVLLMHYVTPGSYKSQL